MFEALFGIVIVGFTLVVLVMLVWPQRQRAAVTQPLRTRPAETAMATGLPQGRAAPASFAPSEAMEMITYWRRVIIVIAFLLPLIRLVCRTLIATFPDGLVAQFYRWIFGELPPLTTPEFLEWPVAAFSLGCLFNWPFFVLAGKV